VAGCLPIVGKQIFIKIFQAPRPFRGGIP